MNKDIVKEGQNKEEHKTTPQSNRKRRGKGATIQSFNEGSKRSDTRQPKNPKKTGDSVTENEPRQGKAPKEVV